MSDRWRRRQVMHDVTSSVMCHSLRHRSCVIHCLLQRIQSRRANGHFPTIRHFTIGLGQGRQCHEPNCYGILLAGNNHIHHFCPTIDILQYAAQGIGLSIFSPSVERAESPLALIKGAGRLRRDVTLLHVLQNWCIPGKEPWNTIQVFQSITCNNNMDILSLVCTHFRCFCNTRC
jgi:hypothetical protein